MGAGSSPSRSQNSFGIHIVDVMFVIAQMAYWREKMQSLAGNGKCDATEEIRNRVADWA